MISSLCGVITELQGRIATIDVHGVGYEVRCSSSCAGSLTVGEESKVIIYTDVHEDAINLYGFLDRIEKQAFLLLLHVKGVGARSASDILSHMDKLDLLRAIGAGDATLLQSVKGVGKKTAERIIVELKDKVGEFVLDQTAESTSATQTKTGQTVQAYEEALQALLALGFAKKEAENAIKAVIDSKLTGEIDSGRILKEALRYV